MGRITFDSEAGEFYCYCPDAALLERMGMEFKAICDDPDQLQEMVNRALSDGQDETPGMQL